MTLENIIFLRRDDALTILEYSDLGKILFPIVKDIPRKETFYLGRDYTEFEITYQNLALRMQEDLDVFICAFEKYLRDYVSMVQPRITSSIESLLQKVSAGKNKRIITFNYTDTLEKLLRNRNIIAEYCYIHGKVDPTKHNRVVLGTDDHMQGENYIPFAPFCKHNQRIFKETDSNYMDWIEAFLNYAMPPSHLFVFGHSCGLSDQDILRGLITAPGMNTSIFAHSDSTKIKLVGNLTEILGKDEMIRRNAGSDRTMEFLEQI